MQNSASICAFLAKILGPLFSAHKTAYRNLHMVFPNYNTNQIDKIVVEMWDNLGRNIGEFPHISSLSKEDVLQIVEINNLSRFDEIVAKYHNVILVSAHFGNWELSAKVAQEYGFPLSVVYRAANNPLADKVFNNIRSKYTKESFTKNSTGARNIIRAMNRGDCLLTMLMDQKINTGIMIPFLGFPASTSTTAADMAMRFKCPILPINIVRQGRSSNFIMNIGNEIYDENWQNTEEEKISITKEINEIIGSWAIQYPSQWFWVHNRWPKKTQN
jgi:KDO2-lipid IV(A) lauroyltransferase